jgi:hypothetical protein
MKNDTSGKTSKTKRGTEWYRLRRLSDADIRNGIESDAGVHATDEKFWDGAKLVLPQSNTTADLD